MMLMLIMLLLASYYGVCDFYTIVQLFVTLLLLQSTLTDYVSEVIYK